MQLAFAILVRWLDWGVADPKNTYDEFVAIFLFKVNSKQLTLYSTSINVTYVETVVEYY